MSNPIAVYSGSTVLYWSAIIISLGLLAELRSLDLAGNTVDGFLGLRGEVGGDHARLVGDDAGIMGDLVATHLHALGDVATLVAQSIGSPIGNDCAGLVARTGSRQQGSRSAEKAASHKHAQFFHYALLIVRPPGRGVVRSFHYNALVEFYPTPHSFVTLQPVSHTMARLNRSRGQSP